MNAALALTQVPAQLAQVVHHHEGAKVKGRRVVPARAVRAAQAVRSGSDGDRDAIMAVRTCESMWLLAAIVCSRPRPLMCYSPGLVTASLQAQPGSLAQARPHPAQWMILTPFLRASASCF